MGKGKSDGDRPVMNLESKEEETGPPSEDCIDCGYSFLPHESFHYTKKGPIHGKGRFNEKGTCKWISPKGTTYARCEECGYKIYVDEPHHETYKGYIHGRGGWNDFGTCYQTANKELARTLEIISQAFYKGEIGREQIEQYLEEVREFEEEQRRLQEKSRSSNSHKSASSSSSDKDSDDPPKLGIASADEVDPGKDHGLSDFERHMLIQYQTFLKRRLTWEEANLLLSKLESGEDLDLLPQFARG